MRLANSRLLEELLDNYGVEAEDILDYVLQNYMSAIDVQVALNCYKRDELGIDEPEDLE